MSNGSEHDAVMFFQGSGIAVRIDLWMLAMGCESKKPDSGGAYIRESQIQCLDLELFPRSKPFSLELFRIR